MATTIHSNGSKWAGQAPDPIETLFERLKEHALDPMFEEYGCFAVNLGNGVVKFWGNFYELSAVFDIDTDDAELCHRLIAAIKANERTVAYRAAKIARTEQADARAARERGPMRSSTAGTR